MKEDHFFGQVAQKAFIKYNNKFVIVKEKGQKEWILPGGRLNVGESTEDGLLREIKEELGIVVRINKIVSVDVYHGNNVSSKTPQLFVFYLVDSVPDQKIVIDNEIENIAFVSTKNDLDKYPMFSNQKKLLLNLLN